MKTYTTTALAALAAWALAARAQAHVTLSPAQGAPGGYYVGTVRVTHGCDGAATTALRVEIPPEATGAKPEPKPGWTLAIEREPLPRPVRGEGGRLVSDRVKAITWRGRLADDEFEAFGLLIKLPARPGPLYLPTTQTCGATVVRWTDIPAAGQAWHDVPHPAPVVVVGPADAADAMAHMH